MGDAGGRLPPDPWPDEDDAAVMARAKVDPTAFAALYVRYAQKVYRYCYSQLGSREAAEDATAAVFAATFAAVPRYREGGSFVAWLFAAARNAVIDARRKRRPAVPLAEVEERSTEDPTPEELAVAREDQATVRTLVASLPTAQRQVIELRLAGLTGHEIAEAMGRSHLAVKMLQFRAINRLRRQLGVEEGRSPRGIADEFA